MPAIRPGAATLRRRRPTADAAVALFLMLIVVAVPRRPSLAQTSTQCPPGGQGAIQVEITQPADGDSVSGIVTVKGTARATLGVDISQVEVALGGIADGKLFPPSPQVDFQFPLDTSRVSSGAMTLRAVACTRRELGGLLARGTREISVFVEPRPADATATTEPAPTTEGTPATVEGEASGSVPDALVLQAAPAAEIPERPLWVGVVVGISGAAGLMLAALAWRGRGPDGPDDDEQPGPVEAAATPEPEPATSGGRRPWEREVTW